VRLREREDHGLGVDRLDAQPPRRVERRFVQDADVDAPLLEGVRLAERIQLEQRQPDARQVRAKKAEDVRKNPRVRRRFDEADAQAAGLTVRCTLSGALRALRLRQREPSLGQEGAPRRRELDTTRDALEQPRADLPLEVTDLSAEWRLRDAEPQGRASEVELFGHGDEVA
jgi:hypothetical protein